jgi:high affinity Mn2+ porin
VLLGAEADVSFPNFLEDDLISSRTTAQGTNVTDQIEYVATLRGRAGYTFDDLADLRDRRIRLVASAVH